MMSCQVDFTPSSKYAFVVSACSKYVPELCALLNSLDYIGNKEDVHVLGYNLPVAFVAQFRILSYKVIFHPISYEEARLFAGESEILCRKRYWYAGQIGQSYDSICILDADMFFIRPVTQYFQIAAKTDLILGAALEQKRMYGHIDHHKAGGTHILPAPRWNNRDICCAPIFVNMRLYCVPFKQSWLIFENGFKEELNFKAPDMEAINIMLLHHNLTDKVVLLPGVQWVGTNEQFLKPYIRIVSKDEDPEIGSKIWTETGWPVYIIHGQPYKAKWRRQQLANRHGCAEGYLGASEKPDSMARGALELLHSTFLKMLRYKIKVEEKAYTRTGHPLEPDWELDIPEIGTVVYD